MGNEELLELYDACYECTGLGDDYYTDEDGEFVSACDTCWVMERWESCYD